MEYSRNFILGGNAVLSLWVFLAALAVWLYDQVFGYLFAIFVVASIYIVLRRTGCNSCAYCKACTLGFGKLAGVFFGTGNTKRISVGTRTAMVTFTYFFMAPLPIALLSLSLTQESTILKIAVLICLLTISCASALSWFSKSTKNSKHD